MPHANDFVTDAFGDGLNYADHKYLLVRHGNNDNQSIVGSEGQAERKQINIKIDQNFGAAHRLNAGWTYQLDDNIDNIGDWPGSYSGTTYRRPQTLTVNATSTLSSTLLNEARFGLNYNKTRSVPAWLSPDAETASAAQSYLLSGGVSRAGNGKVYPVVAVPQTGDMQFAAGVMETCGGSGATANCPNTHHRRRDPGRVHRSSLQFRRHNQLDARETRFQVWRGPAIPSFERIHSSTLSNGGLRKPRRHGHRESVCQLDEFADVR